MQIQKLQIDLFAFVVGLLAGAAGGIFRLSLGYIEDFRNNLFASVSSSDLTSWLWPILFGIIGVSVALFLVKKFAPETSGSGVQEIEGALDELRPLRWKRVLPIKFIASLFSLGSGLLLGREGPTIQIGANIGKMTKDIFKQHENKTNPLVSAGAAAGLASAFNAPLAGVILLLKKCMGISNTTSFL